MDIDPGDIIYILQQLAEQENLQIIREQEDPKLSELEALGRNSTDLGGTIIIATIGKVTYSVATMIMGMTPEQREHLVESVKGLFQDFSLKNVRSLLAEIASNPSVKSVIIDKLLEFFTNL